MVLHTLNLYQLTQVSVLQRAAADPVVCLLALTHVSQRFKQISQGLAFALLDQVHLLLALLALRFCFRLATAHLRLHSQTNPRICLSIYTMLEQI